MKIQPVYNNRWISGFSISDPPARQGENFPSRLALIYTPKYRILLNTLENSSQQMPLLLVVLLLSPMAIQLVWETIGYCIYFTESFRSHVSELGTTAVLLYLCLFFCIYSRLSGFRTCGCILMAQAIPGFSSLSLSPFALRTTSLSGWKHDIVDRSSHCRNM